MSAQMCIKRGASFLVLLLSVELMHISRLSAFAGMRTIAQAVVTSVQSEHAGQEYFCPQYMKGNVEKLQK